MLIHQYSRSDESQCQWFGLWLNASHNFHVLLSLLYQWNFYQSIKNPTKGNLIYDILLYIALFAFSAFFNVNATAMLCDNMHDEHEDIVTGPTRRKILKIYDSMAYVSCFWSIFAIPLFITLRVKVNNFLKKGLYKRVMKRYSSLLDKLFFSISLQIIARLVAYGLVIESDFYFNVLYLRATLQFTSIFFLIMVTKTIRFKMKYLDNEDMEGSELLDDSGADWQ